MDETDASIEEKYFGALCGRSIKKCELHNSLLHEIERDAIP